MTREEHLKYCTICVHRKMNPSKGLVCRLTDKVADFDPTCDDFVVDEGEKEWRHIRDLNAAGHQEASTSLDSKKNKETGTIVVCIGVAVLIFTLYNFDSFGILILPIGMILYGARTYSKGEEQERITEDAEVFDEQNKDVLKPKEPIFPKESFEVGKINNKDGLYGFYNVNKGYNNYPNKKFFPWAIQVTLQLKHLTDQGLPTDEESKVLEDLETKIEDFIKKSHTTHFIGRVTSKGFRDLLFYVDKPNFKQEEAKTFFDGIQDIRPLNFDMNEDYSWKNVGGLID